MKNIVKAIATAAIIIAGTNVSFAQATATAAASATIITPISIVKTVDMNFGNVAVSASLAGTAILAPAGTRTTGGGGGVTLPATTGTVSAASFTVSGQGSYTYAITLPTSAVSLSDGATHTMNVTAFTSSPSATGLLSSGGTQTLTVGATLNVSAGQAANSRHSCRAPESARARTCRRLPAQPRRPTAGAYRCGRTAWSTRWRRSRPRSQPEHRRRQRGSGRSAGRSACRASRRRTSRRTRPSRQPG